MNLNRYRELLGRFHDVILACGGNTAKATGKWLAEFDCSFIGELDRNLLTLHLAQVQRSAEAIAILTSESVSKESLPLSKSVIDRVTSDLLMEIARLQGALKRLREVIKDRGINNLTNQTLSSVAFVMDYMQFDFNGSSLTVYTWPELKRGDKMLRETDLGYRDALCRLIGMNISCVTQETDRLNLVFSSEDALTISLRPEDSTGPEAASFISETGLLWIW